MGAELAEHAVSLAATASAAEEDFEHLALQQPHLGSVAAWRPSNPNGALVGHGARSIIAAYRARARAPPLPMSHCPSARGFRSRNGALSPPRAIASACPSHDPARPPQLPRGQHKAHGESWSRKSA